MASAILRLTDDGSRSYPHRILEHARDVCIQTQIGSLLHCNSRKGRTVIDELDRYWGGTPGRRWGDQRFNARQFNLPIARQHSEAPVSDDCIPAHEVPESNELMKRLGLRTRYHPDGRAYLIQGS